MDLGLKDKVAVVGASSRGAWQSHRARSGGRGRKGDNLRAGCGYVGGDSRRDS